MHYHRLLLSESEIQNLEQKYEEGRISYKESKEILFENLNKFLAPMRQRKVELLEDKSFVGKTLSEGAEFARKKAIAKIKIVRERVGLI